MSTDAEADADAGAGPDADLGAGADADAGAGAGATASTGSRIGARIDRKENPLVALAPIELPRQPVKTGSD